MNVSTDKPHFYSTEEVSRKFNLSEKWLYRARKLKLELPFIHLGRKVCYPHTKLVEWLGHEDLHFLTSKQASQLIGVSERWLKENRYSTNAIPFYRLGRLVRYHANDIDDWLSKLPN